MATYKAKALGRSPNQGQSPNSLGGLTAGQSPASHRAAKPRRGGPGTEAAERSDWGGEAAAGRTGHPGQDRSSARKRNKIKRISNTIAPDLPMQVGRSGECQAMMIGKSASGR